MGFSFLGIFFVFKQKQKDFFFKNQERIKSYFYKKKKTENNKEDC